MQVHLQETEPWYLFDKHSIHYISQIMLVEESLELLHSVVIGFDEMTTTTLTSGRLEGLLVLVAEERQLLTIRKLSISVQSVVCHPTAPASNNIM